MRAIESRHAKASAGRRLTVDIWTDDRGVFCRERSAMDGGRRKGGKKRFRKEVVFFFTQHNGGLSSLPNLTREIFGTAKWLRIAEETGADPAKAEAR